ncbi:hypothetical protein XAC3810_480003 [Xanthomonas citri pv. citri]|uniref:Uncharacterized protein n=1 Tax=Xanthomonas citri pv. citri TaxID=611301 RepID=A0A0U5BUJ8_XANCI|nr:hypothetical protein XAC3824_1050003 [Xanthomonas citri pv. citri]CEE22831.1 hypothetical protein XAC2911_1030003 [Xanthomonas citri pv. citri]CEE40582.1 hypothetical protein XAC3810_480003 [Xanthomonas citri pv. citri]CEE45610.1 hypothetical protein XAC908_710003 [Xanthomonas citri pv. citri]CEE55549.1 hypothetical protein XACW160_1490003 [Xanthomonas citri pv. citri]
MGMGLPPQKVIPLPLNYPLITFDIFL